VGIATRYGLDSSGIYSRWGEIFPPVQTGPGAYTASYAMSTGSFPGTKRPTRGVDHPAPSSGEVIERVELYLYSPSGPSRSVLEWTLLLLLRFMWCYSVQNLQYSLTSGVDTRHIHNYYRQFIPPYLNFRGSTTWQVTWNMKQKVMSHYRAVRKRVCGGHGRKYEQFFRIEEDECEVSYRSSWV